MLIASFLTIEETNEFTKDKIIKDVKILREKSYFANGSVRDEWATFYVVYEE